MLDKKEEKYSSKIQDRIKIFDLLALKTINQQEASKNLKLSVRQIRRIAKRYNNFGVQGLISKKIGQRSNNKIPNSIRNAYLEILREKYPDFGPTFAHEKLSELHDAKFSIETLRQWMIAENIWVPHSTPTKRSHPLRERRSCVGDLVQIDGSKHLWFENRGEYSVLLVAIDDATSQLLSASFVAVENAENYLKMFKEYFNTHGIPASLYSDKHGIFKVNAKGCEDNETQFSRIVNGLGIQLIHANTPQAKGRVERVFSTLQDRLVKELRLADVSTIDAANVFLIDYLPKHNKKFAVHPASNTDNHKPLQLSSDALDTALSFKHQRKVRKDYSISFEGDKFDLYTHNPMPYIKGESIDVLKLLNKSIIIQFQGKDIQVNRRENKQPVLLSANAKTINYVVDKVLLQQSEKNYTQRISIPAHVTCGIQQSFRFQEYPVI
jgi:transposase